MKFLVISLMAIIGFTQAQFGNYRGFQRNYNTRRPFEQPQVQQPQYQARPNDYEAQQQYRPTGPFIAIRSQNKDSSPDGSYEFNYETENGISVSESGSPKGAAGPDGPSEIVQGRYSYTAPDGTPIVVEYYADETGFHPTGAHLPTPPPIPEAIARAIASLPPSNEGQYQEDQYNDNNRNYNRQYNANRVNYPRY